MKNIKNKTLLLFCCTLLIASCNNEKRKYEQNWKKVIAATEIAENSKLSISELPLGFKFGMSEQEVSIQINKLITDSLIKNIDNSYQYEYPTKDNQKIKFSIYFSYYEDKLYNLQLEIVPHREKPSIMLSRIENDIDSKIDTTYKKIKYGSSIKWFKDNQIIFLNNAHNEDLSYLNAPIHKIIFEKKKNEAIQNATDMGSTSVENSILDGSVRQVKSYLKKTLKDPDSYESIEWSKVNSTEKGYSVSHKYRAKNSYGGYVVANQIFYLDKRGNVLSVVDF